MMPDCYDDFRQQPRGKLCVSFRGQMNPIRLSRQAVEVVCCRDGPYASSMETAFRHRQSVEDDPNRTLANRP